MVQKNGIHFITVKSEHGQVLNDTIISNEEHTIDDLIFTTEDEFFTEKTNRGSDGFGSTGT